MGNFYFHASWKKLPLIKSGSHKMPIFFCICILQYHEEKSRIKDTVKLAKVWCISLLWFLLKKSFWWIWCYCASQITLSSTLTFEDFKSVLLKDISTPPISDFNLKVGKLVKYIFIFSVLCIPVLNFFTCLNTNYKFVYCNEWCLKLFICH